MEMPSSKYTFSASLQGATTSPTVTAELHKQGNLVTCTYKALAGVVTKNATPGWIGIGNIPALFCPAADQRIIGYAKGNNSAYGGCMFIIDTTGRIRQYDRWSNGTNLTAGSTCGSIYDTTLVWTTDT